MLTHTDLTAAETRVLVICIMSSRAFCERLYVFLSCKRYAALVFLNCSFGRSSLSSSKSVSSISKSPACSSGSISCTKSCGCLTSSATRRKRNLIKHCCSCFKHYKKQKTAQLKYTSWGPLHPTFYCTLFI